MNEPSLVFNFSYKSTDANEGGDGVHPGSTPTISANRTANSSDVLYEVPVEFVVLLSLLYGSISLVAFLGNAVLIWLIATSRRMHSATNCYIANLAFADIIISVFSIPFQFQAALLQRWNLPHIMCPICPFFQVLSVNVSIFTLVTIAVDRYCAIIYPLRHRPTRLRVKLVIAMIWIVGSTTSAPHLVALRVAHKIDKVTGRTKPFCTNTMAKQVIWSMYSDALVALQYFIPLLVISYAYWRICWVLWGTKTPGNAQGPRDANMLKNKKKVIKMLIIVVSLFAICWLPLQAYHVLQFIFPSINYYRFINIIWFCCHWLAMSNSCCNPFIYGIYNEKFQREFRAKCHQCCKKRKRSTSTNGDISQTHSLRMSLRFQRKPRNWIQGSTRVSQSSSL